MEEPEILSRIKEMLHVLASVAHFYFEENDLAALERIEAAIQPIFEAEQI